MKRGPDQSPEEMSFFDHLEELRWHLVRSVIVIVIAAVALFTFRTEVIGGIFMSPFRYDFVTYRLICEHVSDDFCPPDKAQKAYLSSNLDSLELVGMLSMPAKIGAGPMDTIGPMIDVPVHLKVDAKKFVSSGQAAGFQIRTKSGTMVSIQATSPYEQFMKALMYALFAGLICAFPYVMWEFWRFVRPALAKKEAKKVRWNVLTTSLLFFTGVLFGYYVILPTSVMFLSQFVLFEEAENIWRIGDVINFELMVLFGTGLVFQMPLIIYYLSLIGMVTPQFLRKYRRHAVVVLLVIAAIITPSPDPFSQLLVFFPLILLYEVSIAVSSRVAKRKEKEEQLEREKDKAEREKTEEKAEATV